MQNILIACKDGLSGFPQVVRAVYPETHVKLCADLKAVYSAASEQADRDALDEFAGIWDSKYPMIYQSWVGYWEELSEFFKYPPEIRLTIDTTNAVQSLNYQLRKVTKNRSSFSTDNAILK